MKGSISISLGMSLVMTTGLGAQQVEVRAHSIAPMTVSVRPAVEAAQLALLSLPSTLRLSSLSSLSALSSLSELASLSSLSSLASLETLSPDLLDLDIPVLRYEQDSDSALWRQAREEMNRQNNRRAADLFQRLIERYPRSAHVGDAHYWRAFALSRLGGTENLRTAKALLETQKQRHANATTRREGDALLIRIQTELARNGEAEDAEEVTRVATQQLQQQECPRGDDEEMRGAALNALVQMGSENAMPILNQILSRKDACSAPLRRRAVFLVSQQRTTEKEDMLLDAARNDPDASIRGDAVFWLGQVNTEKAIAAIEAILNSSTDRQVQDKAIHALSQNRSPRASQILRTWAESENHPVQPRERAIFWLGQHRDPANATFLKSLYGKLGEGRLKEQVLFALSQRNGEGNEKWLMDIAMNEQEDVATRKKALFHAGQMRGAAIADFVSLYDKMTSREMKEQLIFVYSQRREKEAVDKMIDIARKEPDRKLRQSAIFWLGQSKDPRAVQALAEIIG